MNSGLAERRGANRQKLILSAPPRVDQVEEGVADLDNVEILLHNISHKDLIISVQNSKSRLLARPEFNHYNDICQKLFECFENEVFHSIYETVYHRHEYLSSSLANIRVPLGYSLESYSQPLVLEKTKLRIRQKSHYEGLEDRVRIIAAYMPLLCLLVPKWLGIIDAKTQGRSMECQKVLVLVSGEGTPYSSQCSPVADAVDNSTEFSAKIMRLYIKLMYPDILVLLIHSKSNVFRYDENISFVNSSLLPYIETFRNKLASKHGSGWR